mmetsp:Transcript_13108/g.27729  ORF Transcript_13108/g.27729 Transcript_13108/m.27729 type:complete len:256 (+) Transcript_13108:1416-2183(+)
MNFSTRSSVVKSPSPRKWPLSNVVRNSQRNPRVTPSSQVGLRSANSSTTLTPSVSPTTVSAIDTSPTTASASNAVFPACTSPSAASPTVLPASPMSTAASLAFSSATSCGLSCSGSRRHCSFSADAPRTNPGVTPDSQVRLRSANSPTTLTPSVFPTTACSTDTSLTTASPTAVFSSCTSPTTASSTVLALPPCTSPTAASSTVLLPSAVSTAACMVLGCATTRRFSRSSSRRRFPFSTGSLLAPQPIDRCLETL